MMKTLEKRMAAREGFTLVELIVVIAILAILAAVAYPVYTGYIERAHDAAALETLGSIATAAQGMGASKGTTVTTIEVKVSSKAVNLIKVTFADGTALSTSSTGSDVETFKLLLTGDSNGNLNTLKVDGKTYEKGAEWTAVSGSSRSEWKGADKSALT